MADGCSSSGSSSSGSSPPSEGGGAQEREESTEEKFERYKIKGKTHVERVGECVCQGGSCENHVIVML